MLSRRHHWIEISAGGKKKVIGTGLDDYVAAAMHMMSPCPVDVDVTSSPALFFISCWA